jgi:Uma2 family endonuclease
MKRNGQVNQKPTAQPAVARKTRRPDPKTAFLCDEVRILDPRLAHAYIRDRQERGIDRDDEVWEGVYIVPPIATNAHQGLIAALIAILYQAVVAEGRGRIFPGANVSNRRAGWKRRFRGPDIVVVLNEGKAVDCTTHWMGGPDFLIEVQSPRDQTDEKIPFYSELGVRELLIIHRDTRQLRLYRHDGKRLAPVEATDFQGSKWLVSAVVPLAFRRKAFKAGPQTEVCRTDAAGAWSV